MTRTSLRNVAAPERVSAGDTISISIELSTQAGGDRVPAADTIAVTVEGPAGVTAALRVERPSRGRSRIAEVRVPAPDVREASAWRRFEVRLDPGADPLGVEQTRAVWIEVTRERAGTVLVSIDPDWESRQILPVLGRASSGGAESVSANRARSVGSSRTAPESISMRGYALKLSALTSWWCREVQTVSRHGFGTWPLATRGSCSWLEGAGRCQEVRSRSERRSRRLVR